MVCVLLLSLVVLGQAAQDARAQEEGEGDGCALLQTQQPAKHYEDLLQSPYQEPSALQLELERSAAPLRDEEETLQRLSAARAQGYTCPDGTYFPPNKEALVWDCRLFHSAHNYAFEMGKGNFLSHVHNGLNACNRTEAQGYPALLGCGENIAAGQATPAEAIKAWQASNGHCLNMYRRTFIHAGVGKAIVSGSTYKYYWVADFGSSHRGANQDCIGGTNAPTPPPGCADILTTGCDGYKRQGYCAYSPNVQQQCKETCGLDGCGDGSGGRSGSLCGDTDPNCGYYYSKGYCSNVANVQKACRKSCSLCR